MKFYIGHQVDLDINGTQKKERKKTTPITYLTSLGAR